MIRFLSKNPRLILQIVALGFVVRVIFMLFIAKHYFGRENIYLDLDFSAWSTMFENLLNHGVFSYDINCEYGYFGRMPGYPLFMGLFYMITGSWAASLPWIAWAQIILDSFAIYLIYKISMMIYNNHKISVILTLLYTLYPFVIVWNPVAYSESLSIFFMILFTYFLLKNTNRSVFLAGLALSCAIYCRPQFLLFAPIVCLFFLYGHNIKTIPYKKALIYIFSICLFYGLWPLRNYILYDKVILTQDIRAFETFDEDFIAFRQYIYSVKTEFEPQFTQILSNKPVEMPAIAYSLPGDSAKLEMAIYLAKNYGSSFSHWRGYWKEPFKAPNKNQEINVLFNSLRENQIRNYPFRYYVYLPLQNLSKAFFKIKLNDSKSFIRKLASSLFIYRTLLLLLGVWGVFKLWRRKAMNPFIPVAFVYFIMLYITLCAGTGPQFRNIEMRYFLPADILMLIPAAYLLYHFYEKFFTKKAQPT